VSQPIAELYLLLIRSGVKHLSLFAATAVVAALLGRTVAHIHRTTSIPGLHEHSGDIFWSRHHYLDSALLNLLSNLPAHLQIQSSISEPRGFLIHVNIQATTICLHQAACFRAHESLPPSHDINESKRRCLQAAETILTILRIADKTIISQVFVQKPHYTDKRLISSADRPTALVLYLPRG
jgi:hypothetical protein